VFHCYFSAGNVTVAWVVLWSCLPNSEIPNRNCYEPKQPSTPPDPSCCGAPLCAALLLANYSAARAAADRRFEVAPFGPRYEGLNWRTNATHRNGHFLAAGNDEHRQEINTNGNFLAAYYDVLNTGSTNTTWTNYNTSWTTLTGAQKADDIETNYIRKRFTNNGVEPKWVILNEIWKSTWPTNKAYREWVINAVKQLNRKYHHEVIILAPFATVQQHDKHWQQVATYAYIGAQNYLSGQEITNKHSITKQRFYPPFSVRWCQKQYQETKDSYGRHLGRKLVEKKLFLVENFAQTEKGAGDGRAGVSPDEWVKAIKVRSIAAHNVHFAGFVSYAWGKPENSMVPDSDMIRFENTYAAMKLP